MRQLNFPGDLPTNLALFQSDQDTVYEQDLLRDAGSVKPWLAYIEFKQSHGTLYEQAFVCPDLSALILSSPFTKWNRC